jgi:radical SAM protein with 4Fe4S-binding SPASM domain
MSSGCWVSELYNDIGLSVHPFEAFVLSLCTGLYTADTLVHIVSPVFTVSLEEGSRYVDTVLHKLRACIDWLPERQSLESPRYDPQSFLYDAVPACDERLPSPAEMTFVLTRKCNFRCAYCYNSSGNAMNCEMETGEWLSLIRQAEELDVVKCTLTGGEPMIHPSFPSIVRKLAEDDILTYICTNGSLIDEYSVSLFREVSLPMIQISLDSAVPDIHHRVTHSSASFEKVVRAVGMMVDAGIKVYVKAVMIPDTVPDVGQLADLCAHLGVTNLILDSYDLSYEGRGDNRFFLTPGLIRMLERTVEEKKRQLKDRLNINLIASAHCWSDENDVVTCGAFQQSFVVMPDGSYPVCEKVADMSGMCIGQFPSMSVSQMWHSPGIERIMQPSLHTVSEPCSSCSQLDVCRTGCFAAKRFVSSNPYAADPRCWKSSYEHNQFRAACPEVRI